MCAVMSQGRIIEMGSYAELSHAGGAFESLMKLQMGSQADDPVSAGTKPSADAADSTDANVLALNVHSAQAAAGSTPAAKVVPR